MYYILFRTGTFFRDNGSLSPRHGASSGCRWRNSLQYGG